METIKKLLQAAIKSLYSLDQEPVITPSPDLSHGDYSTNVAMQLAAALGKPPREIAAEIINHLNSNPDNQTIIQKTEAAGPGFLNFTLTDSTLASSLSRSLADFNAFYKPSNYQNKTVVAEFSDPNPFKVLHIGHFYTSVVGDSISNLIEYAGGTVHRVNFGGDVGLHVAKTMWAIQQDLGGFSLQKLAKIPKAEHSTWMAACYVAGTRAYEDDPAATSAITQLNQDLYAVHANDDHTSDLAQVYWQCRTWSYESFDAFYARIGIKFEKYYPESSVASLGLEIVKREAKKGIYKESSGAIVFAGEPFGLHTRVFINQNGLPTYEAKDVGLIEQKWADYHFDKSIVVTGNEQSDYMKVVLKSIEQFNPKLAERTTHLTHGMVKLPGTVKMSSRKGNFVRAEEVIDLVSAAEQKAAGSSSDGLALGAIKYAFLKNKLEGDIIFDVNESVNLHGNSGPYLQYSAVRASSILKKIGTPPSPTGGSPILDSYERALLLKLLDYQGALLAAVAEYAPHKICTYLYELAQTFNRFYEKDKVIGGDNAHLRYQLTQSYRLVLSHALGLLGIAIPEKM